MTWILFVFCVLVFEQNICAFMAPLSLPPLITCPTAHPLPWGQKGVSSWSMAATPGESSLKADYTLYVVNAQNTKQKLNEC